MLDSHEHFEPVAVEALLAINTKVQPLGERLTSLEQLTSAGRIDMPDLPERWAPKIQEEFGGVGYLHRVVGGGLVWLQYWLFYLHNPKAWVGYGIHEGDWEFVQVGYAGQQPVCATASQHRTGEACDWWDIELRDGRPIVYVGRDSHANFFARTAAFDDQADGCGRTLDNLRWLDFGRWVSWHGRWGNSTGAGLSPQSPGCQGERWHRPHRYHSHSH